MNKTFLFLTVILFCLVSACLPINKKIAVPVVNRPGPATTKKTDSESSLRSSKHETEISHPSFALSESLKLESDVVYHKRMDNVGLPVEEDIATEREGSVLVVVGPQLSKEYISERVSRYEGKLKVWNEIVGREIVVDMADIPEAWLVCVREIRGLAAGYQSLWQLSESGREAGQSLGAAWGLLRRDIHFLDGGCEPLLQQVKKTDLEKSGKMVLWGLERGASLVADYMRRGDYLGVISSYENMVALLPADEIGFPLTWQYSQALSFSGRLKDAMTVLHDTLSHEGVLAAEMSGRLSRTQMRALSRYADLLFVLGNKVLAKKLYLRLDDDFARMERENDWVAGQLHFLADYGDTPDASADYVDLLGRYISFDGRGVPKDLRELYVDFTKKYSEFGLLSGARRIMRRAEAKTRLWGDRKLAAARMLMAENDFVGARKILAELHGVSDDMVADVEELMAKIATYQRGEVQRSKLREKEEVANRWQEANALSEQKEYDAAIVAFSSLLDSEYRLRAKRKLLNLTAEMVVSKRRQAANLFIQGQKTADVQKKMELFRRARLILVEMLQRYPEIDRADKIRQNLSALDEQIADFDPDFLESMGD